MANLALLEKKWFPLNVNGMFSWHCGGLTRCRAHVLAWKKSSLYRTTRFLPNSGGISRMHCQV